MSIRVTVEDTESGEVETVTVDDYLIVTAAPCYLAARQASPNGTHTLTVKGATRPPYQYSEVAPLAVAT